MANEYYSEKFEFYIDSPFLGTHDEFEETFKLISICIEEIKKSNNLRHVVIETWLIVDYFIRNALGHLFGFKYISTDEYDLRHKLLPISFDSCLDVFQDIIKLQRALPTDPTEHEIKLPGQFWTYLIREHNEIYKSFMEILNSYYVKFHPEIIEHRKALKDQINPLLVTPIKKEQQKYCYNKRWLDTYEIINEEWLKKARWLNKTRNFAAHSYDASKILISMGFNGPNAYEQAKNECLKLIERLLGIKKIES